MDRSPPGEGLPASQDDIDIGGADLETAADAPSHFGRDQARARAQERIIHQLAPAAVVDDGTAHALDRLLARGPTCPGPFGAVRALVDRAVAFLVTGEVTLAINPG